MIPDVIFTTSEIAFIVYDTKILDERPKKSVVNQSKKKIRQSKEAILTRDYPWRQPLKRRPIYSYEEIDSAILEILDELFNSRRVWV